jgi:acyl carrier protein
MSPSSAHAEGQLGRESTGTRADPAPADDMTQSFRTVVARILNIPVGQVTTDIGPASAGNWTSLRHFQLVAAMEDEYGVRFSSSEIRSFKNVGQLYQLLSKKRERLRTD